MNTSIIESNEKFVTLQITIPLSNSFLETETRIQSVLNEAGTIASGEALKQFDTDGLAYIAASPEYGREIFLTRLRREVEQIKGLYPNAHY